jgi:hypothetical protein
MPAAAFNHQPPTPIASRLEKVADRGKIKLRKTLKKGPRRKQGGEVQFEVQGK